MVCPSCGAVNPEDAAACGHCAASLRGVSNRSTELPTIAGPTEGRAFPRAPAPDVELGARYRILEVLGEGGMGTVYRAHDRELDRIVALKRIRPELAEDPAILDRFRREIQLSSLVTHRNVLRVYDLGEAGGTKFLTMQYVDGEDLSAQMKREGRLPVPRVIEIFRQICDGLAAAHEQGVVHRDLKPQNVLIDATGHVFVADFGIAKSVVGGTLTATGSILGTPSYMSPEQVKGEKVDVRSDIYSAGVMLYEMLAGEVPFASPSAYEAMVRRLQRPPVPIVERCPDVPPFLGKILDRCMAVDPGLRYASAAEIVRDLDRGAASAAPLARRLARRWPWAAAVLVVGLAAIAAPWALRAWRAPRAEAPAVQAPPVPLVGVLPLENRTGDAALDWYGEGVARLLRDNLAQSRHVHVVSMERVRSALPDGASAAASLGALRAAGLDFVVTGEILKSPGGLTLAARVTDTDRAVDLGAKSVEVTSPEGLVGASTPIATAVRAGLGVPLSEQIGYLAADFASRNADAYAAYVAGLEAQSEFRHEQAGADFARALENAPDFAMARYRLAQVHAVLGRTDDALREVERAAADPSKLDDREARFIRAAAAYFKRDYDGAVSEYRALLERYPYEMEARAWLSQILLDTGQVEAALTEADAIKRADPKSPLGWSVSGHAHLAARHLSEAVVDLERYVELEPGSANARHVLADAYYALGELDLAAGSYREALRVDPAFHYAAVNLGVVEALLGKRDDAERRLDALASDASAGPRFRADAALQLAYLRRAEGRFREAAEVLAAVERPIAEDGTREALALTLRASSALEAGDLAEAGRLATLAVARSPGVPTRYLFSRGLVEWKAGRLADARKTGDEIGTHALPPGDPDRTEDKAAGYLRGLALLAEGKPAEAVDAISRAVALEGYDYTIYRMGLAEAYLAAGRMNEALAAAKQAAETPRPDEPGLERELDRARAGLLLARVDDAMGRPRDAAEHAHAFLTVWDRADAGHPDVLRARRLAAPPATAAP